MPHYSHDREVDHETVKELYFYAMHNMDTEQELNELLERMHEAAQHGSFSRPYVFGWARRFADDVVIKYRHNHATRDWHVPAIDMDALVYKIAVESLIPEVEAWARDNVRHRVTATPIMREKISRTELVEKVDAAGSHFFDRGAKKFFNSKLESEGFVRPDGNIFFVTSEAQPLDYGRTGPRAYTVREFYGSANIRTVGEFMGYGHRADALAEARGLARH